jgi:hypothetical protein
MIAESIYGPYIFKFFEDYESVFSDQISLKLIDFYYKSVEQYPTIGYKLVSLKSDVDSDPFCFFLVLNTQGDTIIKDVYMSGTDSSLWILRADVFFQELFKDILVIKFDLNRDTNSALFNFYCQLSEFGDPKVEDSTYQTVYFKATKKIIDSFKEYKKSITQT